MISGSHGRDAALANGVFCLIFSEGSSVCLRVQVWIWHSYDTLSDWDIVIGEHLCVMLFLKKKSDSFSPRYVCLNVCICIMGTQYPKEASRRRHIPWNWSYGPHIAAGTPWRCREGPVEEWWVLLASEPLLRPLRILLSLLLSNAFQKGLQCISFPSKLQGSSCPLVCSRHGHSKSWQHK